jgi:copper chaperone CopZ
MKTAKFKTNIKCSGCVAQVTPFLDSVAGKDNWQVDIQNPDKVLTVSADGQLSEGAVIEAVTKAGFKAEEVK